MAHERDAKRKGEREREHQFNINDAEALSWSKQPLLDKMKQPRTKLIVFFFFHQVSVQRDSKRASARGGFWGGGGVGCEESYLIFKHLHLRCKSIFNLV